MSENVNTFSFRGNNEQLASLKIKIDGNSNLINLKEELQGQFNIKCIFEKTTRKLSFNDAVLGELVHHERFQNQQIHSTSSVFLSNDQLINEQIQLLFDGDYSIGVKIFVDKPVHNYPVLDALPIPINLLTVYIYFSEHEIVEHESGIQKHFDAYSHLGFFLVDLERMKVVIEREYGVKELDLVHEFSNTDIIDKLFDEEIIMIVWGINPYTYPIYSCENPSDVIPILGTEYLQTGVFNIDKNLTELSLVPGHELKNYPSFLEKDWYKVQLKGKGKKVFLKPYLLQDSDFQTVLASFLIYREEGHLEQAQPLMNVDLLYSE